MKSIFVFLAFAFGLVARVDAQVAEGDLYFWAEKMPEFPAEHGTMASFLANNVRYPEAARDKGVEGRVFVYFVVEKDGTLSDVKVARPGDESLDAEAVRVVSAMPRWTPGYEGGQAVRVRMSVPIAFKIGEEPQRWDADGVCLEPAKLPSFPGGEEAMNSYFVKNVIYPAEARKANVQGSVYVSFVVDVDGSIADARVVQPVDERLDSVALAVVSSMPKWVPAEDEKGNKVKSRYAIPVEFSLANVYTFFRTMVDGKNAVGIADGYIPSYPGGVEALKEFFDKCLVYPVLARKKRVQGRVLVSFVVDVDGSVTDVKVVSRRNPFLDAEAVRVVRKMPKWIPAEDDAGVKKKCAMSLPIDFIL